MRLAEADSHPDAFTHDQLIAVPIASADWDRHLGQADNQFVNAPPGLMLTS